MDNLNRVLISCREDSVFLDALKANLDSGFDGKSVPMGQLGIWEMSLAAVQAFRGREQETEKDNSILALEKTLLQVWIICGDLLIRYIYDLHIRVACERCAPNGRFQKDYWYSFLKVSSLDSHSLNHLSL